MGYMKKKIRTYEPNGYVTLQKVKIINEEDISTDFKWGFLKNEYEETENDPNADWIHYLTISLFNAILFQRRGVFVLSRNSFRNKVLLEDKNWSKKSSGFGNKKWTVFLSFLTDEKILKKLSEEKEGVANVYELIDEDILKYIKYDKQEQIKESFNYRNNPANKNKDLELKTDEDSLQDSCKSSNWDVEIRNKKLEVRENLQSSDKISFQQLLFRQHPDGFPSFGDIPMLAQLAVENCEDFDIGAHTLSTLRKHLKSTCKGKISSKQKTFMEKIVTSFEFEAEKHISAIVTQDFDLKEPEIVNQTPLRVSADNEEATQSHTLSILKASFGADHIKSLRKQLLKAPDEEKRSIQAELTYWEEML